MKRCWMIVALVGLVAGGCSSDEVAAPMNNPPELPAQSDVNATVGDTVTLSFQASDRDGDTISYRLTAIIRGLSDTLPNVTIDSHTGVFHFTPAVTDKPFREFIVYARDGRGGEDEVRFKVNVTG